LKIAGFFRRLWLSVFTIYLFLTVFSLKIWCALLCFLGGLDFPLVRNPIFHFLLCFLHFSSRSLEFVVNFPLFKPFGL
jgi:hypothetical protein